MIEKLGTVLPDAAQLKIADALADRQSKNRERIGDRKLAGCEKRVVGGEVRYYDTTDQYAIVSRQGNVLWFAVTPNGDFRIN